MNEASVSFADGKAHLACIQCFLCAEPPMDISDFYEHYAKDHMDGFHCFSCDACGMKFQTQLYAMSHSRNGCSVKTNKVRFVADLVDDTVMENITHIQTALNVCVEFCDKDTSSVLMRLWERIMRAQLLEAKVEGSVSSTANMPNTLIEEEDRDNSQSPSTEATLIDGQSPAVSEAEVHASEAFTVETSDLITADDGEQYQDDHQHPSTSFAGNAHDAELYESNETILVDETSSDSDDNEDNEEMRSASNGCMDGVETKSGCIDGMDDNYHDISSDSGVVDHPDEEYLDTDAHNALETPSSNYSMEKIIGRKIASSPARGKKRRWGVPESEYSPYKKRPSFDAERATSVHSEVEPSITVRLPMPSTSSGSHNIEQGFYNSQVDYRQSHITIPKKSSAFRGSRGGRGRYPQRARGAYHMPTRRVESYADGSGNNSAHYRDKGRSTKHHGSRR